MVDLYTGIESPTFCDVSSCLNHVTDQLDADIKKAVHDMVYVGLGLTPPLNHHIKHHMNDDIPLNHFKYDFTPLNFVTKVIQNDLYTIIIDAFGKKCVVKARFEKFDKEKGLMVCLFKYLALNKKYSDIMKLYPDNPKLEKAAVKGALVSFIGKKDFDKFMEEYD